MAALGAVFWMGAWGARRCRCVNGALLDDFQVGYRAQQQTPMAERRNANLFEVVISQISQNNKADVVLGKTLGVLPET